MGQHDRHTAEGTRQGMPRFSWGTIGVNTSIANVSGSIACEIGFGGASTARWPTHATFAFIRAIVAFGGMVVKVKDGTVCDHFVTLTLFRILVPGP
jgi:hypothetical protein